MRFSRKNKEDYQKVLKKYFFHQNEINSLQPLSEFLQTIKKVNFSDVVEYLKTSPKITENFSTYLHNIFRKKSINLSLTEAGILSESAFFPEFKKRLLNKILPAVENDTTIWQLIEKVSTSPKQELAYIEQINEEQLDDFLKLLRLNNFIQNTLVREQILLSINILTWRVLGSVMDTGILNMVPEYRNFKSPFVVLKNEIDHISTDFIPDGDYWLNATSESYKQLKIYLSQCFDFIDNAFKNSTKYGISAKINHELLKINQQLQRIKELSWLLVIDPPEDLSAKSRLLILDILRYKSYRNNLKELVDDNTRLMSHLITNHTAETGIQYITPTYKGYVRMFWKSMAAGSIVGILCVLTLLLSEIKSSEFLQAIYSSLCFGLGFVLIYLMRYMLATTQPAMTAATMAKVLSESTEEKNYTAFAHLVARMMRSQFISFLGNILMAFPVALICIYGLDVLFNLNFANLKADAYLKNLNPFKSKLIWHATLTGLFIFLSGIIAGSSGNSLVYNKIPDRIKENTKFIRIFGTRTAENFAIYIGKNWAGIVSNFWFGVLIGVVTPIGKFLGLDLGFRHLTISAGNFALGLYGKDFQVSSLVIFTAILSIFLIGFLNFWVSFGLSILLAFRSRRVPFEETKKIAKETFNYFIKNPFRFFFPVQSYLDSRAQEIMEKTKTKESLNQ